MIYNVFSIHRIEEILMIPETGENVTMIFGEVYHLKQKPMCAMVDTTGQCILDYFTWTRPRPSFD